MPSLTSAWLRVMFLATAAARVPLYTVRVYQLLLSFSDSWPPVVVGGWAKIPRDLVETSERRVGSADVACFSVKASTWNAYQVQALELNTTHFIHGVKSRGEQSCQFGGFIAMNINSSIQVFFSIFKVFKNIRFTSNCNPSSCDTRYGSPL